MGNYVLSEQDYRRLQTLLQRAERYFAGPPVYHRRQGRSTGGNPFQIAITNTHPTATIYADTACKIVSYDDETGVANVKPIIGLDDINFTEYHSGQLCIVHETITPLGTGIGFIGGIQKMIIKDQASENLVAGLGVGLFKPLVASPDSGKAIRGDLFTCVGVVGNDCWVLFGTK